MTPFPSIKAPPDILCLYSARALRGFGDGFAIIVLPVYLSAIGVLLVGRYGATKSVRAYP